MTWPKLKRAPIKEAILQLRYSSADIISVDDIKSFADKFEGDFPEVNQMFLFNVSATIQGDKAGKFQPKRTSNGYRLSNNTKSFVLTITVDSLTFTKLRPYVSWEEISAEIKPILEKLARFFPQLKFSRISLRYINEFSLEFKGDPRKFLRILPTFPESLPQTVEAFNTQIVLDHRDRNLKAIIKLEIHPTGAGPHIVVLDIDTIKFASYNSSDTLQICNDFEDIRNFKNEIFFNALTEETVANFH